MSDLPNINDLLAKDEAGKAPKQAPNLQVSSPEVEEKFKKKMGEVDLKEREKEAAQIAQKYGLPHIDLEKFPVSHEAMRQIDREDVQKLKTVCFYATPDEFKLGTVDPSKEVTNELLHELEERNHAAGALYVISKKSLERVLKLYENLPVVKPISKDIEIHVEDLDKVKAEVSDFKSFQKLLDQKSTSDLLTLLLGVALKLEASDLHVEAEAEQIVIRLRLDGILHDAAILPKDLFKQLVNRIKLVASLKINIIDKPQDGRFSIKLDEGDVDVRVSTMPTVYGESVVMRLLHQNRKGLDLDSLGLRGSAYVRLKQEIERPNGMIITTGPTGSGKTTTMYAIMQLLNKSGVKIVTLEDPVEYKMEGINQSQVEPKKGFTFSRALKSLLRQDPDIAMVGEIRDLETAEIAVQESLTGHLILSTIHTNNAAGAIPRFLSMGVKPFLLAPALNAVIGQRLVRRICEKCIVEDELDSHMLERVGKAIQAMPETEKQHIDMGKLQFYKGKGCEQCGGLGYKGRIGIFEIFSINKEIEENILSGRVSEYVIEEVAVKNGMVTMVQDGILKALDKLTSLEEIFRVTE